jgi:hypothetical protein
MTGRLDIKKSHNFFLFIVIFSFFILPRFVGGIRLEEIVTAVYAFFVLPYFILFCFDRKIIPCIIYFIFLIFSFFLSLYSDILYYDIQFFNWIYFSKYFLFFSFICLGYYSGKFDSFNNSAIKTILYICLGLNFLWMLYQIFSGNLGSLLGADKAFSYGLALIGEAAAFQVGSLLALFFFISLSFSYEKESLIFKILGFLFVFFLVYAIYLTQSRVSLLGILLGLIIFIYVKTNIFYKYLIISFSIITIIWLFSILQISISKSDNNRFTLEGALASYEARGGDIWAEPIGIINENIFIGHGLGALSNFNKNTNEMHNYYLKLLLEGGLFYLIVFVLFLISIFFLKNKQNKYLISMKLYLFCLLLSGFLQDSFSSNKAVIPLFFLTGYFLYFIKFKGVRKNV